jgi:DNA-binding transcriptional ArsR family regulator
VSGVAPTETWSRREGPLLRAALRGVDAGNEVEFEQLAEETGLDLQQVSIAMRALQDAGYLDASFAGANSGLVVRVHERTRRELGTWPSADAIAADVLHALEEAAEREPDGSRKSWLRSFSSGAADVGRGVLAEAISATLRQHGLSP